MVIILVWLLVVSILAEMFMHLGNDQEAQHYAELGKTLREQLYDVAWNGQFFTHHVSEDPSFERDFGGTNPDEQVSLSNAYNLNRNIDHDKCVEIIKTYQRIREEMPESSPGEFYQIYPPFENGYGNENGKWHYMNGGVGTIVAGELAHGAFEHGYEAYGFDILKRVKGWGDTYNDFIPVALRGCAPANPSRTFECIDLTKQCNVDTYGAGDPAQGIKGWTDEGDNDFHMIPTGRQEFLDIPFDIIDPAQNERKAVIGLAHNKDGYANESSVPVHKTAKSLYFLHTCAGGGLVGHINVIYADGTTLCQYVQTGRELNGWFLPAEDWFSGKKWEPIARLAWEGPNKVFDNLGVFAYGWNNPHPDKEIATVEFVKEATAAKWFVFAMTASDQPVLFPSSDVSFGIPDCWGASAVVYAVMEGVAGVKDLGRGMDTVQIAPRWAASDSKSATVTVKLPSSRGYARYRYALTDTQLSLDFTCTADDVQVQVLLPQGKSVRALRLNGAEHDFEEHSVESSRYVHVHLHGVAVRQLEVDLA